MANNVVKQFTMNQVKDLVGRLAQTNYYQVDFSGFNPSIISHLVTYTFSAEEQSYVNEYITRKMGLLCTDASLPSSSFATAEVKDNFMGVTQDFAHTRLYTDIDFTFYVDANYDMLRILEGWMDYISGGGAPQVEKKGTINKGYYRRFVYPDDYKTDTLTITKFERNYEQERSSTLVYTFINAFPKSLTPVSVTYGAADLLKVTATFNYDRYIVSRKIVNANNDLAQQQFQRQLQARNLVNSAMSGENSQLLQDLSAINQGRRNAGIPELTLQEFVSGGF